MKRYDVAKALRHFGFKQTIRGALIIAILGGIMMGAYGTAIVKVYPTEASRQALVRTLESTPAINFLSGEVKDAGTPASYSIYKSLPMMVLLTSIWGLMVVTRLLRGNEEDGRMELLTSGATTRQRAGTQLLIGFGYSLACAVVLMWAIAALLGAAPHVDLSPSHALYMTLAVLLPGFVFAGVGTLTSQLTLTRGKAVLYGLVPLIALYAIRGVANTNDSLNWLKQFSPFGWSDLMDSVLDPHLLWIIPSVVTTIVFVALGLYCIGRRDYGVSLLGQGDEVRSRLYLLGSPFAFVVRVKKWVFFWWTIATVVTAIFMAALAGLVSNLIHDSGTLGKLAQLSPQQIKLLFIGESFMIFGLILLAMIIVEVASIRRDEAKGYLDNLLMQPMRRWVWLTQRLAIVGGMALVITCLAACAIWGMAQVQQVDLGPKSAVESAVAVLGGLMLVSGVGAFLYGTLPRLAVIGMVIIVGWAFVVDILKDLFNLSSWIEKTSILYYIPINPSQSLDWRGIACLFGIGIVLAITGVVTFTHRDIVSE